MSKNEVKQRRRQKSLVNKDKQELLLDDLREFEKFKRDLLPMIREDVSAGMRAPEIREKYLAYIQAAQITAALVDPKAASERKDILDRQEGKATEKKEIKHTMEGLSDEELQALVKTELEELDDDEA